MVLLIEKITSYIIIFAFGSCVYNLYPYFCFFFFFFAFGFCVYWPVFLICIILVFFFFSYITIVVNLDSTAHGNNN
jgi:hypothetical protein